MSESKMFMNNVSSKEYQSLLKKYDIPIENISYEYITQCTNAQEIENIIRILRSGEEGFYPDLLKFTENKLVDIKPNSLLLQFNKPVISKNMLPLEKRHIIESDLENWIKEIKNKENDLCEDKAILNDNFDSLLPKIRNINEIKQDTTKSMKNKKKEKKISSCDYAAWDKYDVDTELSRIELQEQQNQIQTKRAQQERKDREEKYKQTVKSHIENKSSLTDTELSVMAEAERAKGNEAFKAGDYKQALDFYDASITLNGNIASYNNRAMTYIKLKKFASAHQDCCTVLNMEPKNVKALFRRGTALENLQEKSEALKDFEAVVKIEPNNKDAKRAIQRIISALNQKNVRMKIVNKNENFATSQNGFIKVPISYYRSLSYVDIRTACNCSELPTSSHHIYPSYHPRNVHCIIGEKVQAERLRKMEHANTKIRNSIKKLRSKINNLQINNEIMNNNNNNNDCEILSENNLNENEIASKTAENSNIHEKLEHVMGSKQKCNIANLMNDKQIKTNGIINKVDNNNDSEESLEYNRFTNHKIDSPYEFLRVWQSLKNDSTLSQHAKLLRSFNSEKFVTVIGNNMDSDMWSVIISCFVNHFLQEKDINLIVKYLNSFYKLDRFKITLMFMNLCDKKGLEKIFDYLEKHSPNELKSIRANDEI